MENEKTFKTVLGKERVQMFRRLRNNSAELRKEESGAVMLIVAAFIILLLGCTALAVDYGIIYFKAAEYQKDLDAAARAASVSMMKYIENNPGTDMTNRNTKIVVNQQCAAEVDKVMQLNGYKKSDRKTNWVSDVQFKQLDPENFPEKRFPVVDVDGTIDCDLTFGRVFRDDPIRYATGGTAETTFVDIEGQKFTVDVVFVLDISGSMYVNYVWNGYNYDNSRSLADNKLHKMVLSVDKAIEYIKSYNPDNRIGVTVYSGRESAKNLINLTKNLSTNVKVDTGMDVSNTWKLGATSGTKNYLNYKFKLQGIDTRITVSGQDDYVYQKQGGTFIQLGIYNGAQMLMNAKRVDDNDRTPSLFVMTDGEATYGNKDYVNLSKGETTRTAPVLVYVDEHYQGGYKGLAEGNYDANALANMGMSNIISSIKVAKGYQVTLYWNNFDNRYKTTVNARNSAQEKPRFTQMYFDNTQIPINDQIGSMVIRRVSASGPWYSFEDDSLKNDIGTGSSGSGDNIMSQIGANTVLTPCYWKPLITNHYININPSDDDHEAMFYSMGFSLDTITYRDFAEFILFPSPENKDKLKRDPSTSNPARYMINILDSGSYNWWFNPYDHYFDATSNKIEDCLSDFAKAVVNPARIYTTRLTR